MRRILWILILLMLPVLAGCRDGTETVPTATETASAPASTDPILPTDSQEEDTVAVPPATYPAAVKEKPAVPEYWKVSCGEYVSLRERPDGEAIAWISPDDTMQVMGWDGVYAHVSCRGISGYVMSDLIEPADTAWTDGCLRTVEVTAVYSYEQMCADMQTLASRYCHAVSIDTVGYSENGLPIPVMVLGDINATRHVLLQGAMHGREHMTAWLLMAMADCWLEQGLFSDDEVCFHIIPMTNPDGVKISQNEVLSEMQLDIYESDRQKGYTYQTVSDYAAEWKANALGNDINRNFSSGWHQTSMRQEPSSQRYGGQAPFTAAEAIALRDYTRKYPFDITLSYHSSGSVIYYEYGTQEWANRASKELALAVGEITGYTLAGSGGVDGAGYKDWAIDVMHIPSLTVEIGCGDSPLAETELYSIFARNLFVLPMLKERLLT